MDILRKQIGFSFKELEQALWTEMLRVFGELLSEMLKQTEEHIFSLRGADRYESKGFVRRSLGTLFGQDVNFERRRYIDRETGAEVYLLDEVLGIEANTQVSPALTALMLTQAVTTSSYRKAAESISSFLGFEAVSHETIRQTVLRFGEESEAVGTQARQDPQGRRKVNVLFLEADGMWVPLQRSDRRRLEEKVLVTHEGWEPRYSGSKDYRLKNVRQYRTHNGGDFWEEASRWVYTHYDLDDDTIVVINGDRAEWIRQGVDYFPKAMYQIDRFHLTRDLKRLFRHQPKAYQSLLEALHSKDTTGATFLARFAEAKGKLTDKKKREEAGNLMRNILEVPEATVDYRERLKAMDVSVDGFRGLGAAESQIDRFSDRIKGGRSWRPSGLSAMMELQRTRNEGILGEIIERLNEWCHEEDTLATVVKDPVRRAVRTVAARMADLWNVNVPVKHVGTTRSGGTSSMFWRMDESGMPAV